MKAAALVCFLVAGCSTSDPAAPAGGADLAGLPGAGSDGAATGSPDLAGGTTAMVDQDHDGLDDADELAWASAYLPYLSHSPTESCALGGLLVRVSPHPQNPKLVYIVYDFLYDADCGTA